MQIRTISVDYVKYLHVDDLLLFYTPLLLWMKQPNI